MLIMSRIIINSINFRRGQSIKFNMTGGYTHQPHYHTNTYNIQYHHLHFHIQYHHYYYIYTLYYYLIHYYLQHHFYHIHHFNFLLFNYYYFLLEFDGGSQVQFNDPPLILTSRTVTLIHSIFQSSLSSSSLSSSSLSLLLHLSSLYL